MKPSVDTQKPQIPQTIGLNYKRHENEMQRAEARRRDNSRLDQKMRSIQKEEHYPRAIPQKPYTLRGKQQKEEMARINYENGKLIRAIENRKPTLRRSEWRHHVVDHKYQVTKMSEFQKTVPMNDIITMEYRSSMSRPNTTLDQHKPLYPQHTRPQTEIGNGRDKNSEIESPAEETPKETKPDRVDLTDNQEKIAGAILDSDDDESAGNEEEKKSPAKISLGGAMKDVAGELADDVVE